METVLNSIDGRLAEPKGGKWLDNVEPGTGKVYSRLPDSDASDVDAAVRAASAAFPKWSATPPPERSRVLLRLADLIERDGDALARAESIDNGKVLRYARAMDAARAANNLRFFATMILHLANEMHIAEGVALNYTLRQPVGVAGLITPWNFPVHLFTWKVGPALAFGCTAVAKPSEMTPMTAFMVCKLAQEAGLPPGVLNVVHGTGAGAGSSIVTHAGVKAVSFTGGTSTGAAIASSIAPTFKKMSLEMGGKNPFVVFADADLDDAVEWAVKAAFNNQGQICLCGSRMFIEKKAYPEFVKRFVAKASALKVGDPLGDDTDQGALISAAHLRKVEGYVELAKQEGGRILCGGSRPKVSGRCAEGFFYSPTIIDGLAPTCRTQQEEIFGPVTTVTPFETEDEALALANGVKFGLSASVFTSNLERGHRVAAKLEAGVVWVNCWFVRDLRTPFGGWKESGVGREGGADAWRFFTETKNVCVKTSGW